MNKKILIAILSAAVVLLVTTLVYVLVAKSGQVPQSNQSSSITEGSSSEANDPASRPSETSKEFFGNSQIDSSYNENEEATNLLKTFGSIGNEYTLHSRHYNQGEVMVEKAPKLGWDGDLILTVKSAQVQNYTAADDNSGDAIKRLWDNLYENENLNLSDPCVLKLDMTLTNKDAEYKNGVRYQFDASMFRLAAYDDLIPENWMNAESYVSIAQQYGVLESQFDKHADNKSYWDFTLAPGETLDFTLQFLIDRKYLELNTPFLAVSSARQIECGVLLDEIE